MTKKNTKLWIWVQNNKMLKALSNHETGTITIYDEHDKILLKRTGLTKREIKNIEDNLSKYRIKRLDDHKEPFTYL